MPKHWEELHPGPLKDQLRSIVTDAPTALNLDTLVREPEDLEVLIQTLRDVSVHTVTQISMRYCALKSEEAVAFLVELCGEAYENPKPKGVLSFGPNLCIVETLYLSDSLTDRSVNEVARAWQSVQGGEVKVCQVRAPGLALAEGEEPQTMHTFRRKLKAYNESKPEQRNALLPKAVIEAEEAGYGKKKAPKKGGGKKKK